MPHLVKVGQAEQVAVPDVVGVAIIVDVSVARGALAARVEVGGSVGHSWVAEGPPVILSAP
jgi:hypothetical protein